MIGERAFFDALLALFAVLAALSFVALLRRPAPYGRYTESGRGPAMSARWGWIVMESPALWGMVGLFVAGRHRAGVAAGVFLLLWLAHYTRRALLYPLRLPASARPLPLLIVASAFLFQLVNAYLNGRWLFELGPPRSAAWLLDPRFLAGVALFAAGSVVNSRADAELLRLRAAGPGYRSATGGLFRWVSCPHYLGEIAVWLGWALATWCLPALLFALWTIANLAPRARSHHRFCLEKIAGYPPERRALLPGVW